MFSDSTVAKRKKQVLEGRTLTEAMLYLVDNPDDQETDHQVADSLLCDALMEQGQICLVGAFKDLPKWYA